MLRFFKRLRSELFSHAWRDWFGSAITLVGVNRKARVGERLAFGGDRYVISRAGRLRRGKQRIRLHKVPNLPSLEMYLALDEYSELTEEAFDRFLREGIYGK